MRRAAKEGVNWVDVTDYETRTALRVVRPRVRHYDSYDPNDYGYAIAAAHKIRSLRKRYAVTGTAIYQANHELVCEQPEFGRCGHRIWRKMVMKLNGVSVRFVWLPHRHEWKRVF